MAGSMQQQSSAAYHTGVRGLAWGALIGAIVVGIVGIVFGLLGFGTGGVALHAAAGACVGGIIGALSAMIRKRR
jgi:hypothetical protein